MKALYIRGHKKVEVAEVPELEPKDDLVVVKIMASVLCGTEHTAFESPTSIDVSGCSGHEAAGIVWKTDKARYVKKGDHVSIYPTVFENCLRCVNCFAGEWQRCLLPRPKRSRMGTHTQYMLVPEYTCMALPDPMPFSTAAMIDDCLGTPYKAIKRLNVSAGDTVLITGVGPIGAAASIICKFRQAMVIAVDINDYRLSQASKNGADYAFNPNKTDILAKVKEITNNRGVDIAIDCSGVDTAQVQCLDAVRGGGGVAFLGIRSEKTTVNITRQFILKELRAIGSWASTPQEHIEIVDMIQKGLPAQQLITHQFNMDDAQRAFDQFFSGQAVKVAIMPH